MLPRAPVTRRRSSSPARRWRLDPRLGGVGAPAGQQAEPFCRGRPRFGVVGQQRLFVFVGRVERFEVEIEFADEGVSQALGAVTFLLDVVGGPQLPELLAF